MESPRKKPSTVARHSTVACNYALDGRTPINPSTPARHSAFSRHSRTRQFHSSTHPRTHLARTLRRTMSRIKRGLPPGKQPLDPREDDLWNG